MAAGHGIGGTTLFTIGDLPITNTVTTTILVDIVIIALAAYLYFNRSKVPGVLQSLFEMVMEFVEGLMDNVLPKKFIKVFFPLIMTFFIFILLNNWFGLLPGMETIMVKPAIAEEHQGEIVADNHLEEELDENLAVVDTDHKEEKAHKSDDEHVDDHADDGKVALFKGTNADLNTTVALAVISLVTVQFSALYFRGPINWVKHFFHVNLWSLSAVVIAVAAGILFQLPAVLFAGLVIASLVIAALMKENPMFLFLFTMVGIIELFLEPVKFVALALRLFGNVFAGEILVMTMSELTIAGIPLIGAAVPFLLLEVLVGLIQPLIFCGLTVTFISLFLNNQEQEAGH